MATEVLGNTTELPDLTTEINQQFFIEPLGGPKNPISYLEAFPETLYNTSLDSNLVAIMYAILGPAGIGTLKQNYLEARLNIEYNGLRTTELDALYSEPFGFARLAEETYEDDTEGLLNNQQWEHIQESDSSYKNRAINFLKAIRAGGTVLGITLAGKSALDRAVEVVENYHALYDLHSDDRLGIPYIGQTRSTEEIILLPRQERPVSAQQILSVEGERSPVSGEFKLTLPLGPGGGKEEVQNTTTTYGLPFNVDFEELRIALEELPVVGKGNVYVTGGPFPGNPLVVTFTNELADRKMPQLLITRNTLADVENKLVEVEVEVTQVGASADGEDATIPTESWYLAQKAIGEIKPVTTILTPGKAPGLTKRQIPNAVFADSEFIEVLRYVTGKRGLPWPETGNGIAWIEPGIENEAPVAINGQHANYVNFHNVSAATAYNENHEEPDYHTGPFSPAQQAQYGFLAGFTSQHLEFKPIDAPVNPPEPLTTRNGPEPVVNYVYPAIYRELATSVGQPPTETAPFWSSTERLEGIDFLEIDLGTVQPVNFITWEQSQKPVSVALAYDLLDANPLKRFIPMTVVSSTNLATFYQVANKNQWTQMSANVSTSLHGMIYTRFIRFEFERVPQGEKEALPFPYSVDIRNLRIGRNVAP